MLSISIANLMGYLGLSLLLSAYGFKYKLSLLNYSYINLAGSLCMIIYAGFLGSVPYLFLNIIWSQVALKDIIKELK